MIEIFLQSVHFAKMTKHKKVCQSVFIRKKIMEIERTQYKRKVLSPKYFFKNQNWRCYSRSKFWNFWKTAILHKKQPKNTVFMGKHRSFPLSKWKKSLTLPLPLFFAKIFRRGGGVVSSRGILDASFKVYYRFVGRLDVVVSEFETLKCSSFLFFFL